MLLTCLAPQLRPLTCAPLTRDRENPGQNGINDVLGNYSLTLIDSLSTLAILAGSPENDGKTAQRALGGFQDGIAQFVLHYGDGRAGPSGKGVRARGFDLDSKVQVFETVIRGLGGLLSAHLFAIGELPIRIYDATPEQDGMRSDDPLETSAIQWPNGFRYDGQLLRLALDLGQRLLPAFYTKTGIPYPRVNLRHGIPFYTKSPLHPGAEATEEAEGEQEITETCSAGAGSLILEFTVLSRLSGDVRFEVAAKRAFWEVWNRRSQLGLIGNGIDPEYGIWIGQHAGIGAGMDSFFEYALKSHILLSGQSTPNASTSHRQSGTDWLDPGILHKPLTPELHSSEAFLQTWHQAHASVKRHLYTDRHHYPYYSNNHRTTGQPFTMWIDSLGAFYPGLLALAGEIDEAIEANLVYTALWTRYSALPERWSITENNVMPGIGGWPGRPEFIESTYYIYRATRDPWYLYVGEMVLKDIKWRCRAPCGWTGLQDVRSGEKSDRMESFFLGETAKYLYLLFDPDHALNRLDAAYVFTTEGHPLILPKKARRSQAKRPATHEKAVVAYKYFDTNFTNSCPVPALSSSLAGSATAIRPDLYAVSRFTGLEGAPNLRGPIETLQVYDKKHGQMTKYRALSNHTHFPWTLPPSLVPADGTCLKPDEKVVTWIEFPAGDILKSVASHFGASFAYYHDLRGPLVSSVEGLKLQIEQQENLLDGQPTWRISHLGSTQLGREELVHFHAEHVRDLKDGAFTCARRLDTVGIYVLFDDDPYSGPDEPVGEAAASADSSTLKGVEGEVGDGDGDGAGDIELPSESLFKHLYKAVTSVFDPEATDTPGSKSQTPYLLQWAANTPTGAGAFPVPSIQDTLVSGSPGYNHKSPASNFPWKTIFLAGTACDAPLPETAARDHQVIVMRRGGCTFTEKLNNIPSFRPGRSSLQMVLVVDEEGESLRPLLETEQVTPNGMRRHHGLSMVLLQGAEGDYDRLGKARAIGMRRKYTVYSQDLRIENAIVL